MAKGLDESKMSKEMAVPDMARTGLALAPSTDEHN